MAQPASPALAGGGQRPTAQLGKRPSTPARQRPCARPISRQARHGSAGGGQAAPLASRASGPARVRRQRL
eukprot:8084663-Alexandrium_andersonii.AAC.1